MREPVQISVNYRVPYADTDQMGVVYYANYLTFFERGRNELLRELGLPYTEFEARGFGLPVLEAHVDYKSPARYDDEITIHAWVGMIRNVRIKVNCEVRCEDRLLVSGHTVHAFVNLGTLRPSRIPKDISEILAQALPPEN